MNEKVATPSAIRETESSLRGVLMALCHEMKRHFVMKQPLDEGYISEVCAQADRLLAAPSSTTPTEESGVYAMVRLAAEGSDWKRDDGESLGEWALRTLSKAQRSTVIPSIELPEEQKTWADSSPFDKGFVSGWNNCLSAVRAKLSAITPPHNAQNCSRCLGSGSIRVLAGGGPEAHEVDAECPQCGGTGVIS